MEGRGDVLILSSNNYLGLSAEPAVIPHRFPLECADEAIHAIKSGEAGKVIFEIA